MGSKQSRLERVRTMARNEETRLSSAQRLMQEQIHKVSCRVAVLKSQEALLGSSAKRTFSALLATGDEASCTVAHLRQSLLFAQSALISRRFNKNSQHSLSDEESGLNSRLRSLGKNRLRASKKLEVAEAELRRQRQKLLAYCEARDSGQVEDRSCWILAMSRASNESTAYGEICRR